MLLTKTWYLRSIKLRQYRERLGHLRDDTGFREDRYRVRAHSALVFDSLPTKEHAERIRAVRRVPE